MEAKKVAKIWHIMVEDTIITNSTFNILLNIKYRTANCIIDFLFMRRQKGQVKKN